MKLACFFGIHEYKVIKIKNYLDLSYDGKMPSSIILQECKVCGKLKREIIYGSPYAI